MLNVLVISLIFGSPDYHSFLNLVTFCTAQIFSMIMIKSRGCVLKTIMPNHALLIIGDVTNLIFRSLSF